MADLVRVRYPMVTLLIGLLHPAAAVTGAQTGSCNGTVCGFATVCSAGRCICTSGYSNIGAVRDSSPEVFYCLGKCSSPGLSEECPTNTTCEDLYKGRLYCVCSAGASLSRQGQCLDNDECVSQPCGDNSVCTNTPGSFNCTCVTGYDRPGTGPDLGNCTGRISTALLSGAASPRRLAEDTQQAPSPSHIILTPGQPVAALTPIAERQAKIFMEVDIDECRNSSDVCGTNSVCVNTDGDYTCECHVGYTLGGSRGEGCSLVVQGSLTGLYVGIGGAVVLIAIIAIVIVRQWREWKSTDADPSSRQHVTRSDSGTTRAHTNAVNPAFTVQNRLDTMSTPVVVPGLDVPASTPHRTDVDRPLPTMLIGRPSGYEDVDFMAEPGLNNDNRTMPRHNSFRSGGSIPACPLYSEVKKPQNECNPPQKIRNDLFSADTIPLNKLKQGEKGEFKQVNTDENQQNNYNTLYDLAHKASKRAAPNSEGGGTGSGSDRSVPEESPYSVAGLFVDDPLIFGTGTTTTAGNPRGSTWSEYDKLKQQRV